MPSDNDPGHTLCWRDLFIGFAIGLWIAVVILLLKPATDDVPVVACGGGCSGCCDKPARVPVPWVPEGHEPYYCVVSDEGGPYFGDEGGAYFADEGGFYFSDEGGFYFGDEGGPYFGDEGGPYFGDDLPRAPVPAAAHLTRDRDRHEYICRVANTGDPYVAHRFGRKVTLVMPNLAEYECSKDANDNAVVTSKEPDPGEPPDGALDRHYCMVAEPDSAAQIIEEHEIVHDH